eukprot:TRINITY_DN1978_c0_g1_i1.p1 TRINITY_DN1978_c0_g1~~TRINITY_DN1978_c0_g1_i1.p1  ORF type:complete len:133 (+),score=22.76 TRINITY_DN1978_c0_g1_i1:53-451(+)
MCIRDSSHGLITYVPVLWEAIGPAAAFSPACPSVNLFMTSGLIAHAFGMLNVLWTIISFDGFQKRSWKQIVGVIVSHLAASMLTLLNVNGGSCYAAIILVFVVLAITAVATWIIVARSYANKVKTILPDDDQ